MKERRLFSRSAVARLHRAITVRKRTRDLMTESRLAFLEAGPEFPRRGREAAALHRLCERRRHTRERHEYRHQRHPGAAQTRAGYPRKGPVMDHGVRDDIRRAHGSFDDESSRLAGEGKISQSPV